jgi:hypothetical protein
MHHVIYLSWAIVPFNEEQLQQLLIAARRRNTELAVTGILLYGNERFVQVLEGEEDTVQEVYALIRRDPRHHNFITFANKPVAQRAFTEWAMGFKSVSSQQLEDVVGHLGPTDASVNTAGLSYYDSRLFDLLRSFVLPS